MAKSYAESVKLPNLVAVPHPSSKFLSRDGLNVEGHNSSSSLSNDLRSDSLNDRRAYISSLIESGFDIKKRGRDATSIKSDQLMELINDKLTTGYHGVRHLFRANDLNKMGHLSRESFRCILNQLCGYISNDTWHKIIPKFGLDYKDTITFEEFISYFEENPKVKKELANSSSHIELVSLANSTPLLAMNKENSKTRKTFTTELSAAYCFALIKSKARSLDFDPREHFPDECFELKGMIMPYHLSHMLKAMNLQLSDVEFTKLWERFDLNNIGGVRTRVFLRLIDYNPNEVDVLAQSNNMLRTKSFILAANNQQQQSKTNNNNNNNKPELIEAKLSSNKSPPHRNFVRSNTNLFDTKLVISASFTQNKDSKQSQSNQIVDSSSDQLNEDKSQMMKSNEELNEKEKDQFMLESSESLVQSTNVKFNENKQRNQSTISENRIKSMAHFLKNSTKFGPHEDLVSFINNKLNHGFLSFKTAFEYVDPDQLGHLLKNEFEIVLREFNFNFDKPTFNGFLKRFGLLKHKELVDYNKFLQLFQSLSDTSLSMAYFNNYYNTTNQSMNLNLSILSIRQIEMNLIEFFHEFYFILLNHFREKLTNSFCSIDQFKRLIEQKFTILTDKSQMDSLLKFINQFDDLGKTNGQLNWMTFFKKFSEIDPWECFKDSCETASHKLKQLQPGRARTMDLLVKSTEESKQKENNPNQMAIKSNASVLKQPTREENKPAAESSEKSVASHESELVTKGDKYLKINLNELTREKDDDELIQSDNGTIKEEDSDDEENQQQQQDEKARRKVEELEEESDNEELLNLKSDRKEEPISEQQQQAVKTKPILKQPKTKNTFDVLRLNYLEKNVEILFRAKFHSINKYFTLLDSGHSERLDKNKFKVLMQRSGLELSNRDVDLLWHDFEAEVIPFSNLVRRFFMPEEFNRIREMKEKIRLDHKIKMKREKSNESGRISSVERASVYFNRMNKASKSDDKTTISVSAESQLSDRRFDVDVLNKIRNSIIKSWDALKRDFQQIDQMSTTHVQNTKAVEIFKKHQIKLTDNEFYDLCKHFSFNNNHSDLDYIKFLKHFSTKKSNENIGKENKSKDSAAAAPKWRTINPTLRKIIFKLRELFASRAAESTNLLLNDLNNLRNAFRKYDASRKSYLTSNEFKELLKLCQLSVSLDDMYLMFSEYDPDLKGIFNYELFIKSLIDKSIMFD